MHSLWCFLFTIFIVPSLSSPSPNLTLYGKTQFNDDNSIALAASGSAFYAYPIRFSNSFSSRFSFSFSFSGHGGFAFLIVSDPNSQEPFLAVDFDTSHDPSLGGVIGNRVVVGLSAAVSGSPITAWIEYRDSEKLIRVWVGYSSIRPLSPIISAQIDLSQNLGEFMRVGFSGLNGNGSVVYTIDHWWFKTFQFSDDASGDGDCFVCSSQDSGFHGDPDEKRKNLALGLAAFGFSVFAVLSVIVFLVMKRKMQVGRPEEVQEWDRRGPVRLSLADIRSATIGFHRNRIVGEGALARVYKGYLPSGKPVAVKRFNPMNWIGAVNNPFTTEFATMVGCLQHKNLVQLQGWCSEGSEMILVYEYLPNGSLEKMLHRSSDSASLLTWKHRLNIVLGVASALTYLHEECEMQIIHRDVKTCNIMLDLDFNAKLGDFGLAEVYEHSCVTREASIPAGTMGYLAPEYVCSGVPTTKSDVYSFGVVMLEVATGRRHVDDGGRSVVDWVWELWEMGKMIEAVDRRVFKSVEIERMVVVGLCCAHPNHNERPTVHEVARILRGEASCPLLPPKKPTVIIHSVSRGNNHSPVLEDSQSQWVTPRSHFGQQG